MGNLRNSLGLSAEALAALLQVQSGRTVRRWEAGEREAGAGGGDPHGAVGEPGGAPIFWGGGKRRINHGLRIPIKAAALLAPPLSVRPEMRLAASRSSWPEHSSRWRQLQRFMAPE